MTENLYTPKQVTETKALLHKRQKGICPIIKTEITLKESVCDHDHQTQHIRAALHRQSNAFEGIVYNAYKRCLSWVTEESLSQVLRNLAEYLEQDFSENPYHPSWTRKIQTMFNALKEPVKDEILVSLGVGTASNSKSRRELFRKAVLSRKHGYLEFRQLIERKLNDNE